MLDRPVKIRFSELIDTNTLMDNLSVGMADARIPGSILSQTLTDSSLPQTEILFVADALLPPGVDLTVTVGAGIADLR